MHGPFFIVNPQSAGGATGRRWHKEILPRVAATFPAARWVLTEAAGQAAALADRARAEGAGLVVAVGGDGTVHEVVNGLMGEFLGHGSAPLPGWQGPEEDRPGAGRSPAPELAVPPEGSPSPLPALGIIPLGTGCDLVKTLTVPRDPGRAVDVLAAGRTLLVDICEISCVSAHGAPVRRYSINMCGCGLSGEVSARVNRPGGPRHGFLAFLLATLGAVVAHRPREVTISVDDGPPRRARLIVLFVCNGQYCGGGMRPGRDARPDDGLLKVVEVGAMAVARIFTKLPRLYSGRVEGVPGVRVHQARKVEINSPEVALVDCDGEQPGRLPASYTVRPAALRVVVGEPA